MSKFSAYYENPEMLAILDSCHGLLTAFNLLSFKQPLSAALG
jgi:hypothetical protein